MSLDECAVGIPETGRTTGAVNEQEQVIAFLSRPRTYGQTEAVEIHSTHGSVVFLSMDHAYKLKRAVKYPYMNYSTPALRKAMCERELYVNRRMAPELYDSVRGIVPSGAGLQFGDSNDPHAIDWVVVMKKFSQHDLLEERRKAGTLLLNDMTALADAIAAFHEAAEATLFFGVVSGIRSVVEENVAMLRGAAGAFPVQLIARYAELSEQWLRRLRAVLGWRRQTGRVRHCHGDLHLNNVCLVKGRPLLFDAIEFEDSFSCIDMGFDLAFMLMDLDCHGLRAHANALLNRYLERTADYAVLSVLPLFLATRAAIRAHVRVAARHAGSESGTQDSVELLRRAIAYLAPQAPRLIGIGGLSGTGKTTVAQRLAPAIGSAPGAVVLRTDVIRKAMLGVPEDKRLDDRAYDAATNRGVYGRMRDLAAGILRAGHSVIADAVFGDDAERGKLETVACETSVEFQGLWLTAPRSLLEQRLAARVGDASDADVVVLAKQLASISEPTNWTRLDAGGLIEDVLAAADRAIRH